MKLRVAFAAPAAAGILLALAACGGSSGGSGSDAGGSTLAAAGTTRSSTAASTPSSAASASSAAGTSSGASAAGDACTIVDAAVIKQTLGADVTGKAEGGNLPGGTGCRYTTASGTGIIQVQTTASARTYMSDLYISQYPGAVALDTPGITRGFIVPVKASSGAGTVVVVKGEVGVNVAISLTTPAYTEQAQRDLAAQIAGRI